MIEIKLCSNFKRTSCYCGSSFDTVPIFDCELCDISDDEKSHLTCGVSRWILRNSYSIYKRLDENEFKDKPEYFHLLGNLTVL